MSKSALLCSALFFIAFAARAAPLPPPSALQALLAENQVPAEHVGLFIGPANGSGPVTALNEDTPFNPASTIKLLPSLAVLEMFSAAHQWQTEVYKAGPVEQGELNGNLYIRGGGDPYLTVESFWALLKSIRAQGIDMINGDIVVDDHVYDLAPVDRSAFDGKPYRTYNGPAGGFMVNFWSVRFTIKALQQGVHIDAFPDSDRLRIINDVTHSNAPCARARRHIGYRVSEDDEAVTVRFSGTLSTQCRPIVMARSVIPVARYAQYVVPGLWRDAGGRLTGRVVNGRVPEDAERIHAHPSRTAAEVVRATNKFSNNMMARHLLLTLGARSKEQGIRTEDGVAALQDWLRGKDIDTPGLKIVNGSGLSRDTRVSARAMAQVLRAGYRSRYAPEFLASLPLAGEDRALRKWRSADADTGVVRVKTGLIDHVRALAGYVTPPGGETQVVVMFINHPGIDRGLGTRLQDAVIGYLLEPH